MRKWRMASRIAISGSQDHSPALFATRSSPLTRPRAASSPAHHRRHQLLDRRRAHLLHHGVGFRAQKLERPLDAALAEGAEAPDIGPPDADGIGADAQRLDDVGAAAESAVDDDRDAPLTAATISGSASMVERPESSLRAPWLDTMIASMPLSAAMTASSQARMPLITIFILAVSRSRLKKSQVMADAWVLVSPERSTP